MADTSFKKTGADKKANPLLPPQTEISDFKMNDLNASQAVSYSKIKADFKKNLNQGDKRFILSELVSNQMSVEEEEQARFEKKVTETVQQIITKISDEEKARGFSEGLKIGEKKAYEEEKAKIAQNLEKLASVAYSLSRAKELLGEQYEKSLIDMAFRLAEIIVLHEVKERPEVISHTVSDILGHISKDDDVLIRLSPDEFEAIDKIQEEIKKVPRNARISFEVDQRLGRGSCVVESLSGEIASEIDAKFSALKEEIDKGLILKKRVSG